jgi:hypothetical protein
MSLCQFISFITIMLIIFNLRSEIDCAVKCKSVKGCSAFQHSHVSQTCQLGRLSNLMKASETDPNATKAYIFGSASGINLRDNVIESIF